MLLKRKGPGETKGRTDLGFLNSLIPLSSSLALMILNETLILLQMLLPSKANQLLGRA